MRAAPGAAAIGQFARKIVPPEGTKDEAGSLVLRPARGGWKSQPLERHMQTRLLVPTMLLALLALPMAAHAQGTVRGMERGAAQGERDAGPVGAVVGGTVGAVTGTIGGILGVEERPRFREYVVRERLPSYRYTNEFVVGAELPESGVTYYDIPADYHVTGYRYTYVNNHAVLVDPRTRRIFQIID